MRVRGRLDETAEAAYLAILYALARDARTIVCDLSGLSGPVSPDATALLGSAGSHLRDWTGSFLAFASPDAGMRRGIRRHVASHVLVVARTSDVVATAALRPAPLSISRSLAPTTAAGRVARTIVARACTGWECLDKVGPASLVVAELVDNAVLRATTDIRLTLAKSAQAVRVSVRDGVVRGPVPEAVDLTNVDGQGMLVVGSMSRSWGVLPTSEGGRVVWAVIR